MGTASRLGPSGNGYGLRGWLRSSGLLSPSQADFQAFLHADGLATSRGFEPRHLQIRNLALYPI